MTFTVPLHTLAMFCRTTNSSGSNHSSISQVEKLRFVTTSPVGNVSQSTRVILIRFISGDVIQRPLSRAKPSLLAICPYLSNIVTMFPTRCSDNFRYSYPRLFVRISYATDENSYVGDFIPRNV